MYYLNDEQIKLRKEIREFVDNEISPHAASLDAAGTYPRDLVQRISELGYCSFPFPKAHGGAGLGVTESLIFLEEISRGMASLGFIFCAHMLPCCYNLESIVNTDQREQWLIPAIKGEKILTFAITEEKGGSDAFGIETMAERCSGGWRLNGSKCWITNAGIADGYIITAKTSASSRSRNISMFFVDAKTEGLKIDERESMVGLNNSPMGTVRFVDCLLPADALIGDEGNSYGPVKMALNLGRLGLAAVSIGMAQSAFEHAVKFASSRGDYGRAIFSYQGVNFPIAEMYSNITIARNMLYHIAAMVEAGDKITLETAALKLFSSEMCQKICKDAVLIHGGAGFRSSCDIERMLRDSQLLSVAEGTSQICKVIISNGISSVGPDNLDQLI